MSHRGLYIGKGGSFRKDKKQVIAYLSPDVISALRHKASQESKLMQEILSEAINSELHSRGHKPFMPMDHVRSARHMERPASIRLSDKVPSSRRGKVAIGGWYDRDTVNLLVSISHGENCSIQKFVENGAKRITS